MGLSWWTVNIILLRRSYYGPLKAWKRQLQIPRNMLVTIVILPAVSDRTTFSWALLGTIWQTEKGRNEVTSPERPIARTVILSAGLI
jgi:hypothetical protein